jgi:hypothetical protein
LSPCFGAQKSTVLLGNRWVFDRPESDFGRSENVIFASLRCSLLYWAEVMRLRIKRTQSKIQDFRAFTNAAPLKQEDQGVAGATPYPIISRYQGFNEDVLLLDLAEPNYAV